MPYFTPITHFDTPLDKAYPVANPLDHKRDSICYTAYDQFVQNPDFKRFLAHLKYDNPEFSGIEPELPESYVVTFSQDRRDPKLVRVNVKQDPASLGRDFPLDQDAVLHRLALSVINREEPKAAPPPLIEATTQTTPSPVPSIHEFSPVRHFRPIHPAPRSPIQLGQINQSPINISPQEDHGSPVQLPPLNIQNPAPQQNDLVNLVTQHTEQLRLLQAANDRAIEANRNLAQNQSANAAATEARLLEQITGLRGNLADANAARTSDRTDFLTYSNGILNALNAERQAAEARQTQLIIDRDAERQGAIAEQAALQLRIDGLLEQINALRQEIRDLADQAAAPIILPPLNIPRPQPAPVPQLPPPAPAPAPQAAAPPPAVQPLALPAPPPAVQLHAPPAPAPAPQAAAPPPAPDGQPDANAQLARLRIYLGEATAERDALRELHLAAAERNNALLGRIHDLEPSTVQVRLQAETLQAARQQLHERAETIARQEQELLAARAQIAQIEVQRTQMEEQLRRRTEEIQQQQVAATNQHLRLETTERERNQYRDQLEAFAREQQRLREQIADLGRRAAEADAQTGQLRVSLQASDGFRQQSEELQSRLNQLTEARNALDLENRAARHQAMQREQDLQQRILELQRQPALPPVAAPPAPAVQQQPPQPVPAPQAQSAARYLPAVFPRPPAQPDPINAAVERLTGHSHATLPAVPEAPEAASAAAPALPIPTPLRSLYMVPRGGYTVRSAPLGMFDRPNPRPLGVTLPAQRPPSGQSPEPPSGDPSTYFSHHFNDSI